MGLFVTCVLGVHDVESGGFDYLCAGQEPACVVGLSRVGNRPP